MSTSIQNFTGPLVGATYLLRGLKMLRQPGLRHFIWMPLLINLVLYSLGFWVGTHYFSSVLNGLIPGWLEWLRWLLWPLFALLLFVAAFFSFTVVANLVAAPFYGPLAGKVQRNLEFALPPRAEDLGGMGILAAELASEMRRMGYFALRALLLLLLSVIPGINFVAPFLWLGFGAWSLSLEYLAYPLEAQGLRFDQQRELASARRLETLAFGGAVLLGLSVPVLNIFIPPAAVVGATLYVIDRKQLIGAWQAAAASANKGGVAK